jgi:YfiH family protein
VWTLDRNAAPPRWRQDPELEGARLCFSTRRGGCSAAPYDELNLGRSSGDAHDAVAENRRRLLGGIGLDPGTLATAGQVHGAVVRTVASPGHVPECDALVSTTPGLAIAVSAADCIPILFAAPGGVAAAHAGWRGIVAGIPEAAVDRLIEATGCAPAGVTAHLGPCIRSCCFRVGPDVAERFPSRFVHSLNDSLHVDLPGAARRRLLDRGLPPDAIHDVGACTSCERTWYYSYRRDRGRTGRLWGVAARLR